MNCHLVSENVAFNNKSACKSQKTFLSTHVCNGVPKLEGTVRLVVAVMLTEESQEVKDKNRIVRRRSEGMCHSISLPHLEPS